MALDHELISQFAKVVKDNKKRSSESTVYGTVKTDSNGNKYVQLDGSDQLTPLAEENTPEVDTATATTKEGDRVSVLIKNHTATVTGNVSSPAVNEGDVTSAITKFDIAMGDQIQANKAYFKDLTADKANLSSLVAAIISVAELIAKDADIENLVADKATVTDLIATKVDADVVIADSAIIEHLKSSNIDVLSLIADKAVIEDLVANNADLNSVEAKNAYLKYATVDFSNIGEATISKLFTDYGVIRELIIEEGTVVKELVGVTIKGDLIEANTLKADKLVVQGSDGLYYKLNVDALGEATASFDKKYQTGLDGSVIIAESITAEKIAVDDLVAFGATIGGFNVEAKSIHSVGKSSVDNTTPGVYMDSDGQFSVGDGKNYIKFAKNEDDIYELDIGVTKVDTGTGVELTDEGVFVKKINQNGDDIGDTSTKIDHEGMTVNEQNDPDRPVLTADKNGVNAKNLHATTYLIIGKDGRSRFEDYMSNNGRRTACFWIGG